MLAIDKPTYTVREVFLACTSSVDDLTLKADLEDCLDVLEDAEEEFESRFDIGEIHLIQRNATVKGRIGKKQMKVVYDYRMVRPGMPGYKYYDKIKASAPRGKCPYCSVRTANTIDHYLPKMKYPKYAVTPLTLVPSCSICNTGKLIAYPTTSEEQTLHPYYDNVDQEQWLRARVRHDSPVTIEYFVAPHANWPQLLKDRTLGHFEAFSLNELFSSHANDELQGIKRQLKNLFEKDPELLIEHLQESYESRLELGHNSWQAAMYNAMLHDDWFCQGGVLEC